MATINLLNRLNCLISTLDCFVPINDKMSLVISTEVEKSAEWQKLFCYTDSSTSVGMTTFQTDSSAFFRLHSRQALGMAIRRLQSKTLVVYYFLILSLQGMKQSRQIGIL
jgi:hypothetical protein